MKFGKKLLCTSIVLLLASCGGGNSGGASSQVVTEPELDWTKIEQADVDLLVWCADKAVATTTNHIEAFKAQLAKDGYTKNFTYTVNPVGEGAAADKMVTDVTSGADVYFFAQDQLSRLVTAGALDKVPELFLKWVRQINTESSVGAGSVGNTIYGYPATADNGYFLYYDGSKLSEDQVKNWGTLIEQANNVNGEVCFNHSSAWYNFGFFYGAGADSVWTTDKEGNFIEYKDTYNSDKGLVAAKAMAKILDYKKLVDTSEIASAGDDCIAIVDGTWDYEAAQKKFGANLKCAELPSYTVDGKDYHTGSFSGNKIVGVKPQETECEAVIAHSLGLYLTEKQAQADRFKNLGWGPSNLEVIESAEVKAAPHLSALAKQNVYAKPQGQFPGNWWTGAGAIGPAIQKLGKDATDAQLKAVLETYADGLDGYLDA